MHLWPLALLATCLHMCTQPNFVLTGRQINSVYKSIGERLRKIWKHSLMLKYQVHPLQSFLLKKKICYLKQHNIFPCLHLESGSNILRCRSTNKSPQRELRLRPVVLQACTMHHPMFISGYENTHKRLLGRITSVLQIHV